MRSSRRPQRYDLHKIPYQLQCKNNTATQTMTISMTTTQIASTTQTIIKTLTMITSQIITVLKTSVIKRQTGIKTPIIIKQRE